MSLLHPLGINKERYFGEPTGFAPAGEAFAVGEVAGAGAPGLDGGDPLAPGAAGRNPRVLGLLSMLAARLFVIFASFMATSSNAALRICLR